MLALPKWSVKHSRTRERCRYLLAKLRPDLAQQRPIQQRRNGPDI